MYEIYKIYEKRKRTAMNRIRSEEEKICNRRPQNRNCKKKYFKNTRRLKRPLPLRIGKAT